MIRSQVKATKPNCDEEKIIFYTEGNTHYVACDKDSQRTIVLFTLDFQEAFSRFASVIGCYFLDGYKLEKILINPKT